MNCDFVKTLLLMLIIALSLSSCSQLASTVVTIDLTPTLNASVVSAESSILYRGDPGRTGTFKVPSIESPVDIRWQHSVGTSVHGAPVLVGSTLLVPTAAARFVALDAESGQEQWTFR